MPGRILPSPFDLAALQDAAGIGSTALARLTGYSVGSIHLWRAGKPCPAEAVAALGKALGMSDRDRAAAVLQAAGAGELVGLLSPPSHPTP